MRLLFISFYLTLFATVLMFFFGIPFVFDIALRKPLINSVSKFAETPRKILEREFADIPQDQWHAHFLRIQEQFDYRLILHSLDELNEEPWLVERLRSGKVTATIGDENDFAYLPIRQSNYVIQTFFSQSAQDNAARSISGYFYLIEKQLAQLPAAEHNQYLQSLDPGKRVPMRRQSIKTVDLSNNEIHDLTLGKIISHDPGGTHETYFKALANTDDVLVIGPIEQPFIANSANAIAILVINLMIGFAVFVWLRPLWKDMRSLDTATTAFGQGSFDSRVSVSKRSPVRELANAFNSMASRIKRLINAQKELTDSVSHELRTPISRLRFGMERLDACEKPQDWTYYKDGMKKDIDELEALVDELLTYSRLGDSKPNLDISSTNVQEWIDRLIEQTRRSNTNLAITATIGPSVNDWNFDQRLLTRALGNLINNAMKFSTSTVNILVTTDAQHLQIVVDDDGEGIDASQFESIFEPFARVETSRNRDTGGYGLGLAIVKRIAQWHQASITVGQSKLGGASFTLRVPNLVNKW